jgi:RNA polymerase sigma-70 factor (ECF subfamily)
MSDRSDRGPTPDTELVRRFTEGDQAAYAEIVRRYQDRVYSLCLRWMGNREIAVEVAQDVFLALYRSLSQFRGDAQLSTWIFRVVVNHCKNRKLYRRRRHEDQHEPLEGEERDDRPAREFAHGGPGTDAAVHAQEAGKLLEEGLAKMTEEDRQIVLLRDQQDLSYEEIADLLGLPRGTVKSRLHRARIELAQILGRKIGRSDL